MVKFQKFETGPLSTSGKITTSKTLGKYNAKTSASGNYKSEMDIAAHDSSDGRPPPTRKRRQNTAPTTPTEAPTEVNATTSLSWMLGISIEMVLATTQQEIHIQR